MSNTAEETGHGLRVNGVGAPRLRHEDARHLVGRGRFVGDMRPFGVREVAFARSNQPRGRITAIERSAGLESEAVWTAQDLLPLADSLTATSSLPGYRTASMPNLASEEVRYVGEPIALAIGATRADAEDLADSVQVNIEPLPAVTGFQSALASEAPRVHSHWPDNVYAEQQGDFGDCDDMASRASVSVTREYTMNRQAVVPLEPRGILAHYDTSLSELQIWTSTQTPHQLRDVLSELLGLDARSIRVISPDVGGAFGSKCTIYPEDVAIAAIALRVDYPIRWIEDRWESMVAMTQARGHHYSITAHASEDGELLAVDADLVVDGGAYSVHPWTATMDASMAAGMIPGPYKLENYRFRIRTVATNKTPLGPYRGVARPGACLAIERTIDELAYELGMEPYEIRLRNMVTASEMPYTSIGNKVYDSGDYPEAVRRTVDLLGHSQWRAEQTKVRKSTQKRIGIGYASFTEQTAHGCLEWATRGLAITYGTESARLVLDPSGSFTLSVGIKSHGQGAETTLAQVVSEVFDIDPDDVTVAHGDTGMTPHGEGSFASRSMVMAGGATYGAATELANKVKQIASVFLDVSAERVVFYDGFACADGSTVSLKELAQEFLFKANRFPNIPGGLEVTHYYRPDVETGVFTYATHGVVVEVDIESGHIELLDYAVVEDCGKVVNPLIVDGQIIGGVAQGIGTALLEELTYDETGQPTATSFLDYLLPGAADVPQLKISHLETPSPNTVFGMKGAGEGGAIAPPAAIANAVTDALREFGGQANETPITPERVWAQLAQHDDAVSPKAVNGEAKSV